MRLTGLYSKIAHFGRPVVVTACLAAFLVLLSTPRALAQERSLGGDAAGLMGGPGDSASYAASLAPARLGGPSVVRQDAGGSYVVARSSTDAWTLTGRAARTELSRSPVIAETGLVVPAKLWDLRAGAEFSRRLGERKRWGAGFGVGSASDLPFHTIRETEFRASAFRETPSGDRNSWLFFLAYSNNRTFANGAPLPGVAYVFREPAPGLEAVVGLPFLSVRYRPTADWRFSAAAFGPTNLSAEASRCLAPWAWAYASVARSPQQWLRAERAVRTDRLILDREQALAGLRLSLGRSVSADLAGGFEFRRRVFEGRDASRSGAPRTVLPNASVVQLRLTWRG